VDFTKDGTSNVIVQTAPKNYHYEFFLLVELETKLITFYHHTLKYHNIKSSKKKYLKILKISNENENS
jgi:hypothetical protein